MNRGRILHHMQVFLPYPSFEKSVQCLDPKRLGNQIYRECRTLITGGWRNHPCSKMWYPKYNYALAQYSLCGLEELKRRGKHYPVHIKFFQEILDTSENTGLPSWIGNEKFHSSHRKALLYKNQEWYSKFGWEETPDVPNEKGKLNYWWPLV